MIELDRTLVSTPEVQALAQQIRAEVLDRHAQGPDAARTLQSEEPLRAFRRELVADLYDQITTLPGLPSFAAALRAPRVPTTVPNVPMWPLWPLQLLCLLACTIAGYCLGLLTQ